MAQEHTPVGSDLAAARKPNEGGTYRDPESGAELTVTMSAGADALVRMGWQQVETDSPQAKPATKRAKPAAQAKVDDADEVEDQQDNAQGHKSETTDGSPGVPAGDPEKLKKKGN